MSTPKRTRAAHRAAMDERGFTLIELLIVVVIIGVLLAIAVPSYLGFKDRAADGSVQANLRIAAAAAEAYYSNRFTYVGMTIPALAAIDAGLSPTLGVVAAGAQSYCLTDTVHGVTWSMRGPGTVVLFPNATCT